MSKLNVDNVLKRLKKPCLLLKFQLFEKNLFILKLFFLFFSQDGKYVVLPSGELQIRNVGPEDGFKTYKCRTKHRLTGKYNNFY